MKFHLEKINMIKKSLVFLTLLFPLTFQAQDIPEKPVPSRLVNDMAGLFSSQQASLLEQELARFAKAATVQIAVVSVNTLNGYEVSDFADRLAENWGIGAAQTDNGVLILIKPKKGMEKGRVTIRVGYGLESVIPDVVAKRAIIENEMIPRLRQNDYFGAVVSAVKIIQGLASKEFTPQEYIAQYDRSKKGGASIGGLLFLLLIFVLLFRSRRRRFSAGGSSLPFWLALGMMGMGGRSTGTWSDFSSGGGSFGGFGGGGFGGGGASGSW
jgi:uncharacterized protein